MYCVFLCGLWEGYGQILSKAVGRMVFVKSRPVLCIKPMRPVTIHRAVCLYPHLLRLDPFNFFSKLPEDAVKHILSFLDQKSLACFARTHKNHRQNVIDTVKTLTISGWFTAENMRWISQFQNAHTLYLEETKTFLWGNIL